MDQQSIDQIETLHPKLRNIALAAYNEAVASTPVGVHPIITQGYRTFDESNALYAKGRTAPGEIVTNAPAGKSYHNYGCALDFALVINGNTSWDQTNHNCNTVFNVFKNHGFEWGGDWNSFKDYPHFEMRFGLSWQQMLQKHNSGDFIPGTSYINIP